MILIYYFFAVLVVSRRPSLTRLPTLQRIFQVLRNITSLLQLVSQHVMASANEIFLCHAIVGGKLQKRCPVYTRPATCFATELCDKCAREIT